MRSLYESLFDVDIQSTEDSVINTLGDRGSILDTEYNLYGHVNPNNDHDFIVRKKGQTLEVDCAKARYEWVYCTPKSTKFPRPIHDALNIDKIKYNGSFCFGSPHAPSVSVSNTLMCKEIECMRFSAHAKSVRGMKIEAKHPHDRTWAGFNQVLAGNTLGNSSIVSFISPIAPITLTDVELDADIVHFSVDTEIPTLNNCKGRAMTVNVQGTSLLDDPQVFENILDPDYLTEYKYGGHTHLKHLKAKNILAMFNQHLKYVFCNTPFNLKPGTTIDDVVPGVSKLNPEVVALKGIRIHIYFIKNRMRLPALVSPTIFAPMKELGGRDEARYMKLFPETSDGYRVVIVKNK